MKEIKKVLTIAGSDSGGGAGIQADLKAITTLGGYGASVIASITAQNTLGVQGVFNLPLSIIEEQIDAVCSDIKMDSMKTGMLANGEIIQLVSKKVKEYEIPHLVVDPVMVATSGDVLLENTAIESLTSSLLPVATVVTPNMAEASVLAKIEVTDLEQMKKAAEIIHGYGPRYVLIKGGHLEGQAIDILYDGKEFKSFKADKIATNNTHGTGCTLSAAIATFLADGHCVEESVRLGKLYLTKALASGKDMVIGGGHGPVDHQHGISKTIGESCEVR